MKLRKAESRSGWGGSKAPSVHPSSLRYDATRAPSSIRLRKATTRQGEAPKFKFQSNYGLARGPVASPNGAPALAKRFPSSRQSLSRQANLSPRPNRLKSHDLQCDFCIRQVGRASRRSASVDASLRRDEAQHNSSYSSANLTYLSYLRRNFGGKGQKSERIHSPKTEVTKVTLVPEISITQAGCLCHLFLRLCLFAPLR